MSEYIIHGTSDENIENILKNCYIDTHPSKKHQQILQKSINQIFTQLIYSNLPNEEFQRSHWFPYAIVLKKNILKKLPFYATHIGSFYDNFNDAFKNDSLEIYAKSKGNLTRMPNLKKLKQKINDKMSENNSDSVSFIHSHEILFNTKIYLKDFCECIIYYGKSDVPKNIVKLCSKLNIPITNYSCKEKFKEYGLNNFITLIRQLCKGDEDGLKDRIQPGA